jgi:hypothetical protein
MTFFNRSHKIAVLCGAIPLSLGTGIFLTWIVFRWSWLALAGHRDRDPLYRVRSKRVGDAAG